MAAQKPRTGDFALWNGMLYPSKERGFYVVTLLDNMPEFRSWIVELEEDKRVFALNEDLVLIPEEE